MKALKYALCSAVIAIVLNIVLSFALAPFATQNEINPPNGASNLSFKSQIVHMLVHHRQVIYSSSLIVGLVTGLSTILAVQCM